MKQSIFYYSAVVLVILGSVLFGLDWQSTTLSPMPPIQVVALPPPPPPPPAPVKPVAPVAAPPVAVVTTPVVPRPAVPRVVAPNPAAPTAVVPVAPASPPVAQTPPKPLCDVAACAAAYRSFRESDCTYNPSIGPRTLCTKGVVLGEPAAAPAAPAAADGQPTIMQEEPIRQTTAPPATPPNTASNAKCNVAACAAAYRTFTESDCTFLATGGQRKLCAR